MLELFLVAFFIVSFALFGISLISVTAVILVSSLFMLLMGMLGVLFKLLPWILVIGLVVFFFRQKNHNT